MLKIGDKVIRNENYVVPEKYKGVVFTVRSNPYKIGEMDCVALEGLAGGYAMDGLTKIEEEK